MEGGVSEKLHCRYANQTTISAVEDKSVFPFEIHICGYGETSTRFMC